MTPKPDPFYYEASHHEDPFLRLVENLSNFWRRKTKNTYMPGDVIEKIIELAEVMVKYDKVWRIKEKEQVLFKRSYDLRKQLGIYVADPNPHEKNPFGRGYVVADRHGDKVTVVEDKL